MRKTKILATLGPASNSPEKLEALLRAGVNAFRLNCSHASLEELSSDVRQIRKVSARLKTPVSIVLDLQGPRLRTGRLQNGSSVELVKGRKVVMTTRQVPGTERLITTNYKELPEIIKAGNLILLDEGNIELKVLHVRKTDMECRILQGGILKEHKGINLPGIQTRLPAMTPKDIRDLRWGVDLGVDYVALSFVKTEEDLLPAKKIVAQRKSHALLIAKIERPEALERIDSILEAADGIMVARGDLAVEMSAAEVPVTQKLLIQKANRMGKMVIVATQMLESMIHSPHPTRAEASDVANAIFDGADAVMLSGETAVGNYPDLAAKTMAQIIEKAESSHLTSFASISPEMAHRQRLGFAHPLARAATAACSESKAKAIVVFTLTGWSAKILAKYKPPVPILALTPSVQTRRQLALVRGVTPYKCPLLKSTDSMIAKGEEILINREVMKKGEVVIVMAGGTAKHRAANTIKIHHLGYLN